MLHTRDILAFVTSGAGWQRGVFHYDGETGVDGHWVIGGQVVQAADVSHWLPLPPDPKWWGTGRVGDYEEYVEKLYQPPEPSSVNPA
jgi:hypothetical protein